MSLRSTRAPRCLVQLAAKADGDHPAISMSEVFDDPKNAKAWLAAWNEARAAVAEADAEASRRPS